MKPCSVPTKDKLFPLLMANWAALWKRHGIAPFATHLEHVDSIQPSRFSRKCHVNVFTERTYVPYQPGYVFQWQSKENLYHSQIATLFHYLAVLPLICGPVSLLGSFSMCAIEISSVVPREQLVLFHPWQPRYWTSPMPAFFLLPFTGSYSILLAIQNGWVALSD